jgi:hypothetical protein
MTKKVFRILIPVIIVFIGIIYFYIDPEDAIFMPKCPWWLLTGTYCPSCGVQRFFHHLFTGNFLDAFLVNPFLVIFLPYAILAVLGAFYNIGGVFDKLNKVIYSGVVLKTYVFLYIFWWVIRIVFGV